MVKMKLLLFLSCVLCVSAGVQHQDLNVYACSDSDGDGEFMYTLEGEEVWYADFSRGQGVDTLPSFVDHATYAEGEYERAVAQLQICRTDLKLRRNAMRDIPLEQDAPSTVLIYPEEDVDLDQSNVLICHVSGFYPAPVNVSWTRNGQKVSQGTSLNLPFPNKDGSFRQTARLDFRPQQGDIYSCSVDHVSLETPETHLWEVERTQPGVGPSVFCGLGLALGLVGVAVGTFFLIKGNECS